MLDFGENALRFGLVRDFEIFALVLCQLGFKGRRPAGFQQRVDGPVFARD